MTDGKKIVYPKMQTYSLHDYKTVLEHMRVYTGNISEDVIRAVIDALVSTMPNSGITTRGSHSHKVWIAKDGSV